MGDRREEKLDEIWGRLRVLEEKLKRLEQRERARNAKGDR